MNKNLPNLVNKSQQNTIKAKPDATKLKLGKDGRGNQSEN